MFNASAYVFAYGSEDIVPMFKLGATPGQMSRIEIACYDSDMQKFEKDASWMDLWVLEKFQALIALSPSHPHYARLRSDKLLIFLHLLGIDSTGHTYRPHSKEYTQNIHLVDSIVEKIHTLMESTFPDQKTSYIFTSDHGMHSRGVHGDGHPDNTRTPLIAWGAGIAHSASSPSKATSKRLFEEPYDHIRKTDGTILVTEDEKLVSKSWGLSDIERVDVLQADIAPLMVRSLTNQNR